NAFTQIYHTAQKAALFSGITRTYQPRDDDGEKLPSEATRVQLTANELITQAEDALTRLFDLIATKHRTNLGAVADVIIDDRVLAEKVPVTYLLFLEKQLTDIGTFLMKLPLLDPAEVWHFDENTGAYATDPVSTARSKKIPRNHVKA